MWVIYFPTLWGLEYMLLARRKLFGTWITPRASTFEINCKIFPSHVYNSGDYANGT